jgi:signal transduction histidine kinase/BarA-like signal transduction histidine kinase
MTDTPRLLVVDDDAALLQALTRALELRMPHVVVDQSDSATAACDCLRHSDYDAVITDIKMPGMDGLSLLAQIREEYPKIPTLLITGHGQHDLAVQALRGGAFDFIQKPVDRDYLVASLNRAFEVRRLAREVERQQQKLQEHSSELELTVEQRTRELRETNAAKDRFLAVLAHELRNPLAAIHAAADVLELCHEEDAVRRRQAEEIISQQVRHTTRLLDDLLDISRITHDRVVLHKHPVNFSDIVRSAIDTLRPAIDRQRHRFAAALPAEMLWVDGDPTRLQQVVANLLTNAVKYTRPEGSIELSVRQQNDQIVLCLQDTGIGIAPEMLTRVFEPFVQVEESLTHSQGGLGIGLTLVRKLVELHGGSIMVSSEGTDRGSTFTVRLPLYTREVESAVAGDQGAQVPSLRILLIEDNPNVASITQRLLTCCGHQVVAIANDGPSALKAAATYDVDVILLDIGLPGMSGYEVARRLRQQPRLADVLIIALTGFGQEEDRRRSRESGCDHHLVKPASVQTLQGVFSTHRRLLPSR